MNKSKNKKNTKRILGKKQKKTRRKISGGRLLGQGSYGVYYGLPPIPCIRGTSELDVDYGDHKYVTKIFENPADADEEYTVLDRIEQSSLSAIENLADYFVLPIDRCDVDKDEINTNLEKYSDSWKRNKANEYYKPRNFQANPMLKKHLGLPIPHDGVLWIKNEAGNYWQKEIIINSSTGETARFYSNMEEQPDDTLIWSKIIIYPIAEYDLAYEFNLLKFQPDYISKVDFFVKILSELTNVSKGIEILQEHNFIHGDIKDENCLVMLEENDSGSDETYYKIGDLSFLSQIIGHYPSFPKWNFATYYCWPLLSVYSYFFHPSFLGGPFAISNPILLNHVIKNQNNMEKSLENIKKILINIRDVISLFKSEVREDFEPYINYVIKTVDKIYIEKTRLIGIKDYLKTSLDTNTPFNNKVQNIISYYANWDMYFNRLGKEYAKLDLYKRIDVYSFGFMLLKLISIFLNAIDISEIKTNMNPLIFIVKLFIVIDMCCIQVYDDSTPRQPIPFNFINEKFDEIIFAEERDEALLTSLKKLYGETLYIRDIRPPLPPPVPVQPPTSYLVSSDSLDIGHGP